MGTWDVSRRQEQAPLGPFRTQPHTLDMLCPSRTLGDTWTCCPPHWASTHTSTHMPAHGHITVAPLPTPRDTPLHTVWYPLTYTEAIYRHRHAHLEGKRPVATPRHSFAPPLQPRAASTSCLSDAGVGQGQLSPLSQASPSTDGETQAKGKQHPAQWHPAGNGWGNLPLHHWATVLPTARGSAVLERRDASDPVR